MPGVTVSLSGPSLMTTRTALTDEAGAYRFSAVPLGDHTLTFQLSGFGTIVREGIHVGLGFTATVNVELSPATVDDSVTVSGAAPVVDVSSTVVTTHFDSDKLAQPAGRARLLRDRGEHAGRGALEDGRGRQRRAHPAGIHRLWTAGDHRGQPQ